jgi:lipopolysaccharide export system permease protein
MKLVRMKLLQRYLAREVYSGTLLVMGALLALFSFLDMLGGLNQVSGFTLLFRMMALRLPGYIYQLMPIAALIGTLYALAQLNQSSEFTVMRVSGMSMRKVAGFLVRAGLVFVLLSFVLGEWVAPAGEKAAERVRLEASHSVVSGGFRSGLWFKDQGNFVNVREVLPDSSLHGIRIYSFDNTMQLTGIRTADRGNYLGNNRWQLVQVVQTLFVSGRAVVSHQPTAIWHSVITPAMLSVLMVSPEQMSASNLITYIRHLEQNKQQTDPYVIALWGKFIYPFTTLIMMLLALPFAYHSTRAGGIGGRIFAGIMIGLAFYLLNSLVARVGLLYHWPPALAALLPAVLFALAAVLLLRRTEPD